MLTEQHKVVNRYLLTQGCVTDLQLNDEYKSISETYPGNIRTRHNNTPIKQIIDDINDFMSFMNARIESYDYELNHTTYYAYHLAIAHNNNNNNNNNSNDNLITKNSINLKPNEIKLFGKILDLSLLNYGLITSSAIHSLNEKLSNECINDNDIINDEKLSEIITFVCEKQYLYKLLPQQNDEKDEKEQSQNTQNTNTNENSYCIGPRTCIGLSNYIQNANTLIKCANCKALVIGYGFKCPYKCQHGIYHERCIKSQKECMDSQCQKIWEFNPVQRVSLLSDPAISQDLIDELFIANDEQKMNGNHNHNMNRNRNNQSDEEYMNSNNSQPVVVNGGRNRKRNRNEEIESQSQVMPPKKRRKTSRNVIDDSDDD